VKKILLLVFTYLVSFNASSQEFSASDFLFSSSFSNKKLESYLNKRNFMLSGSYMQGDTLVHLYSFKPGKKKTEKQPVKRNIETYQTNDNFSFTFLTSSPIEFSGSLAILKEKGFFCGNDQPADKILFQKKNISVLANMINQPAGDTIYSFRFSQAKLPLPGEIQYAEDLLEFYSHEQLAGVFGEKNVINDVYYFSEKEISKCSILFPKTSRQAIFIWDDEVNLCRLSYVLIGSNFNTKSQANYSGLISENAWSSKDGISPGMNLRNLIRLNGNDFKFYGNRSKFSLMVVPENTGKLDFKKNRVILGCLDPVGSRLLSNEMISAQEILNDDPGIYIFMIVLSPSTVPGAKRN
jgi:hypothetical protein